MANPLKPFRVKVEMTLNQTNFRIEQFNFRWIRLKNLNSSLEINLTDSDILLTPPIGQFFVLAPNVLKERTQYQISVEFSHCEYSFLSVNFT
jgi:hypothetical protein